MVQFRADKTSNVIYSEFISLKSFQHKAHSIRCTDDFLLCSNSYSKCSTLISNLGHQQPTTLAQWHSKVKEKWSDTATR